MTRTVVEFFDITTHDHWTGADEIAYEPVQVTAMGKVIHEDEHLLVLSPLYGVGRVGYHMIIPKGCIFSRSDF